MADISDIAMLMLEEFERRNRFENGYGVDDNAESIAFLAMKRKMKEEASHLMELMVEGKNKYLEMMKTAVEPKSPISSVMFQGLFSP
ncbi:hypothetical protein IHE45_08G037000 [Dioscorea alata]|uniref:Uncharacterized protein n=1 Tax=Dioscorea alata TaxID=55571 RepID=A0ACB7VI20_DIOAL|nr:hypothetical protein IHE45_08G037000 [Dioscorea alata]